MISSLKMKKCAKSLVLIVQLICVSSMSYAQNWTEVIEGKSFDKGLSLSGKENVLIKNCQITNANGMNGIELKDCKNIRIEGCVVRHVGNESMSDYVKSSLLPKDSADYPQKRGKFDAKGIYLFNCIKVVVSDCDVTDIFGQGIKVNGDDYTKTGDILIANNRIAYTYDDALKFEIKGDQDDNGGKKNLPFKGGIVRNNVIHDIGLGITQLPFARHGMYLKARDILVEGNTVYNCFYGQGISLRNAGIIRNNKVWNCCGGLCIAYWAQTSTDESSKTVIIEGNQCRQDYSMNVVMRHISTLTKKPDNGFQPMILIAYGQNQADAKIEKFMVRNNTCIANQDFNSDRALIAGAGKLQPWQSVVVENNTLIDNRVQKNYYSNIPLEVK
jgi:hypothetical protein